MAFNENRRSSWICDSLSDRIEGFFKRLPQQNCMHDELIALLMAQECSKNENNVEQSEEVVPTHYRSLPSLRAVRQCAIAIHLIARTRQNLYRLR